jgi:hypothetical protein
MSANRSASPAVDDHTGAHGDAAPVSQTLLAVAQEIGDLARVSDRLQVLISEALIADGTTNADHLLEFQAIDLLVQRLHGVSSFLETLADLAPADWRLDSVAAASNVLLTALANRLSGQDGASDLGSEASGDDGEIELFG